MKTIRIGIYDEERDYVDMLCTFLKGYGKGRWNLAGYTDREILKKAVYKNKFDLLISPDMELLIQLLKEEKDTTFVFLSGEKSASMDTGAMNHIYRFQSAKEIAGEINKIILKRRRQGQIEKILIGIYSPIAGCGKTRLACNISENKKYGNNLYFGMEDYCSFEIYSDTGEVLYYIKERKEDKLLKVIDQCEGKIIIGQGAFENRLLEKEDFIWLKSVLKKCSYDGFIFDLGTGSIKDINLFYDFDYLFVPILHGTPYDFKVENFRKLLKLYELEEMDDKMIYLDMDLPEETEKKMEEILSAGENE